jgi:hypothetical protein
MLSELYLTVLDRPFSARKALADVSNVQGNSSSNAVQDGDKLM